MTITNSTIAVLNVVAYGCFGMLMVIMPYCVPAHTAFQSQTTLIGLLMVSDCVDCWNSNNTQRNYQTAKDAGYSDWYLLLCFGFIRFGLGYMMVWDIMSLPDYTEDLWTPTIGDGDWSFSNLVKATTIVAMTDWVFYLGHKALHEHFPKIHMLHHCCIYTSLTTNIFFEPLDVLAEFTAPGIVVKLVSLYVFESSWICVLATSMMGTYYALTHDELLNLQHAKHHRGCATGYFIYRNYFYEDPTKEQVRKLIPGLYPNQKKVG